MYSSIEDYTCYWPHNLRNMTWNAGSSRHSFSLSLISRSILPTSNTQAATPGFSVATFKMLALSLSNSSAYCVSMSAIEMPFTPAIPRKESWKFLATKSVANFGQQICSWIRVCVQLDFLHSTLYFSTLLYSLYWE